VELFPKRLERVAVTERHQLGLRHQVGRNVGHEGSGDIGLCEGVGRQRRLTAGLFRQALPRRLIDLTGP
jgi:hypothetical protein